MVYIFYFFLSMILIFEGFAIPNGREIALYLLYFFPFIMILKMMIVKDKFVIPQIFSVLVCIFILFSFISTYVAADVAIALQFTLLYIALFLIFLITYNLKDQLFKYAAIYIFLFTFIALCYAFFITFFPPTQWIDYVSHRGYQFVYPSFQTQHPLGRWLIIPTILSFSLYSFLQKKIYLYIFIFLTTILCFTYVRAAYLSLLITSLLIVYAVHKHSFINRKNGIVIILIFSIISVLLFATVKEAKHVPFINSIHTVLQDKFYLPEKQLLGARPQFYSNAIEAIKVRPIFGYGPNNLINALSDHPQSGVFGNTSENIFLEVFAENGIVGGILFLSIILLLIKSSVSSLQKLDSSLAPFIFVFIGLIIMFQIDSSARFFSFLTMLFFIGGLIYKEQNWEINTRFVAVATLLLFSVGQLMILNKILTLHFQHRLAHALYPLNNKNYIFLINEKINSKSYNEAQLLLKQYQFLNKGNKEALDEIKYFYKQMNTSH